LPKIKADETICLDKVIDAGGLENNLTYEWQDLGDTRPTIEVSNEGIYKVKISNQFGCSLIRTVTVAGPCSARIYAPDVFTPNGDNMNDVFKIILVGGSIVRLDIFNRWGNIIYSEENTNPQWNGEFKGSICLNGAYAYILSYKTLQDNLVHEYRGKVLLQK
jgi:gliding motility-associated-like protein